MSTLDYDTTGEGYVRRKYFRDKLIEHDAALADDVKLLYGNAAETLFFSLVNSGAIVESGGTGTASDLYINVVTFGAVGDGVTDDSAAIQEAIDSVPTGGATVFFPAGDYAIGTTLTVPKDGTTLLGEGAGNRMGATQTGIGSRIQAITGITGSLILVQRTEDDRPVHGVNIRELNIEGNSVGTAVDGIIYRSNQGRIDAVNIWNCTGSGLRVQGYASPAWDTYDTIISRCIIARNDEAGAFLDDGSADTHWFHNIFYDNNDNMVIHGSSSQVTGCHFYSGTRYNIYFAGGGSRSKFSNCKIEGAGQHLVFIDSTDGGYSDIQFTGNGFSSISQSSATNTYDYINIAGPSGNGIGRTTIVGNNFNIKGGFSVKARYAINLVGSSSQSTMILANGFGPATQWGTGVINQGGSTSSPAFIKANAGIPDLVYVNAQTTAYTLTLADADSSRVVEVNSASGVAITVPPNVDSGMAKGARITMVQIGAGAITVTAGSGVTLNTVTPKTLVSKGQWATIRLYQRTTNNWIVEGDLA